jgi:hypothetical protein
MKFSLIQASLVLAVSAQTPLINTISLSDATEGNHHLEWQRLSETDNRVTFRICTPFPGWTAVGFNPTENEMEGAEIYEATQVDGAWVINLRMGEGRFLPSLKEGSADDISDVKDAAAACGTTSGVEFTHASPLTGNVNVITAWSSVGTFLFGFHGSSFNVSRKTLNSRR